MKKRILVLALVLITVLSVVPFADAAFTFTDVPSNHKDRVAIEFCADKGFIKGYSDTTFDPDGTITREQFAVIWGRTLQLRMHKFTDVTKVPNEYENAILIMQALGHVNGETDTLFGRTGKITREQAIAIAYRAYIPGVDGGEVYKDYTDYAQISDWARNAIGACKLKGELDGVFTGTDFKPKQNITRGEICHLIYNFMKTEYNVTISNTISGGLVTANKAKAYPGETVTLTITPASGKLLKAGTLKYNDTVITAITGNTATFTMPMSNVTITAQFEDVTLSSIAVKTMPTKVNYTVGETLDLTGMVIEATYTNGTKADVTSYTTSPIAGATLSTAGTVTVTITYIEGGITKMTAFTVTVGAAG